MRIGVNPQKLEKKIDLKTYHRIVLVVYIPNEEGFYKNSFEVFKLSVDSLISTINENCAITVVNNGSCQKVMVFLNDYYDNNKIDCIIHHKNNIGKIDALIGAARGSREKLITYSDSDILFLNGWQENVEKIFLSFPNTGSVSPIPVKYNTFYGTHSTVFKIFTSKIKFTYLSIPENFESYNRYLESINWNVEKDANSKWPVIELNNIKAVIGSGHQVLTIDRDILFKSTPTNPSLTLVGGDSEFKYVDEPIDIDNKLRLSTFHNFAYHMGNNVEEWMIHEFNKSKSKSNLEPIEFKYLHKNLFFDKLTLRKHQLKRLFVKKVLKKIISRYK